METNRYYIRPAAATTGPAQPIRVHLPLHRAQRAIPPPKTHSPGTAASTVLRVVLAIAALGWMFGHDGPDLSNLVRAHRPRAAGPQRGADKKAYVNLVGRG